MESAHQSAQGDDDEGDTQCILRKDNEWKNRRESQKHCMGKTQTAIADEDGGGELGAREFQELEAEGGRKIHSL